MLSAAYPLLNERKAVNLPVYYKINMMEKSSFILLFFTFFSCCGQDSLRITPCGQALRDAYLAMDILHKWPAGRHVDWQTGDPDDPDAVSGIKTHCSAFVAAACERRGIYILRPPQHKQELLANAQFKWLNSDQAKEYGWYPITKNILSEAQKMADEGFMVVACAQNPDRHKPGHIALVMPAKESLEQIQQNGPLLIQASAENSINALFRKAFRHHIPDWSSATDEVLFFYNNKRACPAAK